MECLACYVIANSQWSLEEAGCIPAAPSNGCVRPSPRLTNRRFSLEFKLAPITGSETGKNKMWGFGNSRGSLSRSLDLLEPDFKTRSYMTLFFSRTDYFLSATAIRHFSDSHGHGKNGIHFAKAAEIKPIPSLSQFCCFLCLLTCFLRRLSLSALCQLCGCALSWTTAAAAAAENQNTHTQWPPDEISQYKQLASLLKLWQLTARI